MKFIDKHQEYKKMIKLIRLKQELKMPVNLNIGSGDIQIDSYINIDLYDKASNVKLDIIKLNVPDGIVDSIISSHVIDHFDFKQGKSMIKGWHDMLKSGGTVRVECSNLSAICEMMISSDEATQMKLYSCLFGFPWAEGMAHKFGYTKDHMIKLLTEAGFTNIKDVALLPVDDYSIEKIEAQELSYDDSYDWFDDETFQQLNISITATK